MNILKNKIVIIIFITSLLLTILYPIKKSLYNRILKPISISGTLYKKHISSGRSETLYFVINTKKYGLIETTVWVTTFHSYNEGDRIIMNLRPLDIGTPKFLWEQREGFILYCLLQTIAIVGIIFLIFLIICLIYNIKERLWKSL